MIVKGEFDKALAAFEEAIKLEPKSAAAYHGRASVRSAKKEHDKALEDLAESIRLEPEYAWAYATRGDLLSSLGKFDKALENYAEAVRLAPAVSTSFLGMGFAWLNQREYDRAITFCTAAIQLQPRFANPFGAIPFRYRGLAHMLKRENEKAIEDFTDAILREPKDPSDYYNRIHCYIELKQFDLAAKDGDAVVRLWPKLPDAHLARGRTQHNRGNWEGAIASFDEAIKLDAKHAMAYANRAMIRAACPDEKVRGVKQAFDDATKACELTNWKVPYPLEAYAAVCAEGGHFKEAVAWQKQVLAFEDYMAVRGNEARARLQLYEAQKPFRIALPKPASRKD